MEYVNLLAILVGPISAVLITLWVERRRSRRDSQMAVARLLMATRHLPGDPNYSTAINLIPVEFFDKPKVMGAFNDYQTAISQARPVLQDDVVRQDQAVLTKQTKLISAVLEVIGMRVSEADLAAQGYAAQGMITRDNLFLESLIAQKRIADALEKSVETEPGGTR